MIVLYSDNFHIHQQPLADALYTLTQEKFVFVTAMALSANRIKMRFTDYNRPYLLRAYENEDNWKRAIHLAKDADVAIFGASSLPFEIERMKLGNFSFEVSERWLKKGWINIFSPRLMKNMWYYHTLFHDKPLYKLCSSAYAAGDQYLLHSFKDKCFKWGYFTKVDEWDIEEHFRQRVDATVRIMWCARYLDWKHPELPLQLAKQLKTKGYRFFIDMYGSGVELEFTKKLCAQLELTL